MSDPKIKYREYKGIIVGDANDTISYVNSMSSSPIGDYVVSVGKQGDIYTALNSNGQQITWTAGISGNVYWSNLQYSQSDSKTIEEFLTQNYFTQEEINYKIGIVNTKVDNVRSDLTSHTYNTHVHTSDAEKETWNNKLGISDVLAGTNITITRDPTHHQITISASGSGGKQLYLHEIFAIIDSAAGRGEYMCDFHMYIINDNPNPMNASDIFWGNNLISPVCKYSHLIKPRDNDMRVGTFYERDRVKSGGGIIGNKNIIFQIFGWNNDIEINQCQDVILAMTADVSYLNDPLYFIMYDDSLEDIVTPL